MSRRLACGLSDRLQRLSALHQPRPQVRCAYASSALNGAESTGGTVNRCLTIVTGASRGLGAAIAREVVSKGPPLLDCAASVASLAGARSLSGRDAPGNWVHDVVLSASDSARLERFVREDLTTNLHQHQHQQQSGDVKLHAATTNTRIHTLCFDLGDMDALRANIDRLLASAEAVRCSSAAAMDGCGRPRSDGAGADSRLVGAGLPAWPLEEAGAIAGADRTPAAVSSLPGVLPLPPSSYSHVLLIHNAGQVGDLVPVECQTLDNIRRQTDLNVTSFAYLTAAVLRTFLYTPLVDSYTETRGAQAATPSGPWHDSRPAGAGTHPDHATAVGRAPPTLAREPPPRAINIVNISSVSVDTPYEHFSLYGMGKAARHMIIRSVAHEAALRESDMSTTAAPAAVDGVQALAGATGAADPHGAAKAARAQPARVRALSYAPGAINTDMQAAAREALPAGRLKARFEDNARAGRLVDPRASAAVLYDILAKDEYDNGAHIDYYTAAATTGTASHPLAYSTAAVTTS